jgi:gamma-glutamyltranspeptidase/glutathione hydrolase
VGELFVQTDLAASLQYMVDEDSIGAATGEALAALGHRVEWLPDLSTRVAGVCAIVAEAESGVLSGGADPRRAARAMGW